MEYKKDWLLDVIGEAMLATANNKHAPYQKLFRFKDNTIAACNGRVYFEAEFPSDDLNCFVDAKRFKAVINKMPDEDRIQVRQHENTLVVDSGHNRTRIRTIKKPAAFKTITVEGTIIDSPTGLSARIGEAIESSSIDLVQPILLGVHISNDLICATDRNRMVATEIDMIVHPRDVFTKTETEFMLKGATITKEAAKMLVVFGDPDGLRLHEDMIEFLYPKKRLVSLLIKGEFPPIVSSIPEIPLDEKQKVDIPFETIEVVERIGLMSPEDIPYVTLQSEGQGCLKIYSATDKVGDSFEVLDIEKDKEFKFMVHPEYLNTALKYCRTMYYEEDCTYLLFREGGFTTTVALLGEE